jgi:hypothetical protein
VLPGTQGMVGGMGMYGNAEAHVFTIKKVKFGNETDRLPALPGEYLS